MTLPIDASERAAHMSGKERENPMNANQRISLYRDAFAAYGYYVAAEAVEGEEAQWAASLKEGFDKLLSTMAHISRTYGTRGKSKRALSILHSSLPEPMWGVELKCQ